MKTILALLLVFLMPLMVHSQNFEEIKTADLPEGVQDYIAKNMPGSTITHAAKGIENGNTVYGTIISFRDTKRVMVFDQEGNFLRKAENLNAPAESPVMTVPPPPKADPPGTPMKPVPANALPEPIRKYLKDNHTSYNILEAKEVPLGDAPMFQVILRDKQSDNVYLFNARGEMMRKRSYELSRSPFVNQFPLNK